MPPVDAEAVAAVLAVRALRAGPVSGQTCPCTAQASVTVEWECRWGHRGYAGLCKSHGAIHVAALMSGDIRCGTCRKQGVETGTALKRVNGKTVDPRMSRRQS